MGHYAFGSWFPNLVPDFFLKHAHPLYFWKTYACLLLSKASNVWRNTQQEHDKSYLVVSNFICIFCLMVILWPDFVQQLSRPNSEWPIVLGLSALTESDCQSNHTRNSDIDLFHLAHSITIFEKNRSQNFFICPKLWYQQSWRIVGRLRSYLKLFWYFETNIKRHLASWRNFV